MTITDQVAEPVASLAAQALGLAFPDVPGFGGQGWSTHETMLAVKWLLADPAAWDQALGVAREYPGNPHAVADTLHEQIVPRPVLEAMAVQGLDPARVNWLEIAHELIERRDDPRPSPDGAVTMAGDDADVIPASGGAPVPDDPDAVAMYTAHRLDEAAQQLARATGHLQAARKASGELRAYHSGHVARHLGNALDAGHVLAANLREHYPAEGGELDKTTETIGLAKALSEDAKAATAAHLLQTVLYDCGHASRHAQAMLDEPSPDDLWSFNADHAEKHLGGAVEHVAKLTEHLRDNYPEEGKWLAGLHQMRGQRAAARPRRPTASQRARLRARITPAPDA